MSVAERCQSRRSLTFLLKVSFCAAENNFSVDPFLGLGVWQATISARHLLYQEA
jgi:hypothetical protein